MERYARLGTIFPFLLSSLEPPRSRPAFPCFRSDRSFTVATSDGRGFLSEELTPFPSSLTMLGNKWRHVSPRACFSLLFFFFLSSGIVGGGAHFPLSFSRFFCVSKTKEPLQPGCKSFSFPADRVQRFPGFPSFPSE